MLKPYNPSQIKLVGDLSSLLVSAVNASQAGSLRAWAGNGAEIFTFEENGVWVELQILRKEIDANPPVR